MNRLIANCVDLFTYVPGTNIQYEWLIAQTQKILTLNA